MQPSFSSTTGVPHYNQCGGIGYTGSTTCASPYTCQVSNRKSPSLSLHRLPAVNSSIAPSFQRTSLSACKRRAIA